MNLVAKTYAGLEDLLVAELEALGATDIAKIRRGVTFTGDTKLLYKCNYQLRCATRVLINMKVSEIADE